MSFRLSSVNICAGIVGFACLAFAGASHAGEGARNIEVVPLHGTPMDTNFDQSTAGDQQTFKDWSPRAPRTMQPAPRIGMNDVPPPAPRPQNTISTERERELLDRRRNWVFMTPEDYASDGKRDGSEEKSLDKKPTTVMERYYQHLYDADRLTATNQFGKTEVDKLGNRTNLLSGETARPDRASFRDSPFNASAEPGIFQTVRRVDSSNPFGSDNNAAMPTPEQVRVEAEQKAHMDSFRQLWNIDQPATAPAASPVSASVDSGPLFGLSSPTIQSGNSSIFSDGDSSSRGSQTPAPVSTSPRNTKPPHADFLPQPRPF